MRNPRLTELNSWFADVNKKKSKHFQFNPVSDFVKFESNVSSYESPIQI